MVVYFCEVFVYWECEFCDDVQLWCVGFCFWIILEFCCWIEIDVVSVGYMIENQYCVFFFGDCV